MNEVIIDGVDVSKCEYHQDNNRSKYPKRQFTNMCYRFPYDNCENKPFCIFKIISRIKGVLKWMKY